MRIGLSTYSLDREIAAGRMTLGEVLDWIAAHGGECAELVPFAYRFDDPETGVIDEEKIRTVRRRAQDAGIGLSNYSVLADLCVQGEAYEKEIARICHHVDIAAALGVPCMRHDIAAFRRPLAQNGLDAFDVLLPQMV
ncbi:MAG: sugar phosphate isomerase/epimerase, partial [Clostridia bacterium]